MAQPNPIGTGNGTGGSLILGNGDLGVAVDPGQAADYLTLAEQGMLSAAPNNCGAVQNDRGFRARSTVTL